MFLLCGKRLDCSSTATHEGTLTLTLSASSLIPFNGLWFRYDAAVTILSDQSVVCSRLRHIPWMSSAGVEHETRYRTFPAQASWVGTGMRHFYLPKRTQGLLSISVSAALGHRSVQEAWPRPQPPPCVLCWRIFFSLTSRSRCRCILRNSNIPTFQETK